MISQTAEYALRAIVYLSEQESRAANIQVIAQATKVPAGYLSKVMQNLARHGLVHSQRGLGGGFTLTKEPKAMTIYEIVDAVDPIPRITRCPLDNPRHEGNLCALHKRLDQAAAAVEKSFRETRVSDLLNGESIFES